MLVIGDEILSGRTQDANVNALAKELVAVGIDLCEVRIVPDKTPVIVASLNALRQTFDLVFTCGGIGPTHDDITADAVAKAFDLELVVNPTAKEIILARAQKQGLDLNEARLRMARMPRGAKLVQNSVSGAPGFIIENVYVFAGVPRIFRSMLGHVIDELPHGRRLLSKTVHVQQPEGEVASQLAEVAAQHPNVSIGSYPFFENGVFGSSVVVRGKDQSLVTSVAQSLSQIFGLEADGGSE